VLCDAMREPPSGEWVGNGHPRSLYTSKHPPVPKQKGGSLLDLTCNGQRLRSLMLFSTLCIYKVCGFGFWGLVSNINLN